MGEQPAGQDDLLLVAAGQAAHGRILAGGFDAEGLDVFIGELLHFAAPHGLEEALHHLHGQDDVVPHAQVGDDAVPLAVLGQIADAVFHGVVGLCNLYLFAVHLHPAARHPVGPENGADAFTAAGAQQAGKAVDFALADAEIEGPAV